MTTVWYKQKEYDVLVVAGQYVMIRRIRNPSDVRWVHKDLVMNVTKVEKQNG